MSPNVSSSSQIIQGSLGTVSLKKVAVILDFVQMRGGGRGVPSPNFVSNSNEIKLISLGNTTRINLIFGAFDLLSSAFGAIVVIAPALVICSKNDNTGCGFRVQTAATNIWVEDSSTGGRSAEDILLDLIGYFSLINS